jgi:DNA integrity scanning protein DisA with diadenylate cyclase activity
MAKFSDQLRAFCGLAIQMADLHRVESLLLLLERPTDWSTLHEMLKSYNVVIAGDVDSGLAAAAEEHFDTIELDMPDSPVYERLTQALLEAVADDHFKHDATVVAAYCGFESTTIDTLSLIRLDDHLGRLTVRDLRQFADRIPVATLKLVVDLAIEIGREGREGKSVGTLFVVGDHRRTMTYCRPMGFDPVKGYKSSERKLTDAKVREGVKEIAQMDGAFIVSSEGVVMAAAQHISAPPSDDISLPKGLGARHWAAAEITKSTAAVAVSVSSSGGTVRVIQDGDVVLRIEPFRRAMKWRDFDNDVPAKPPATSETVDPPKTS